MSSALARMSSALTSTRASYRWTSAQCARNGTESAPQRRGRDSNARKRLCRPLPNHSATSPGAPARYHGFTAAYALAYTLIVAASFGAVVLAGLVCVLLPLVAVMAWRRA